MTSEAQGPAQPGFPPAPSGEESATLRDLTSQVAEFCDTASEQLKGLSELAFLEMELAVDSLQRSLWLLLLFGAASTSSFAMLLVAGVLLFLPQGVPAAPVALVCACASAVVAILLFISLRCVSRKMYFSNLRQQLTQAPDDATS